MTDDDTASRTGLADDLLGSGEASQAETPTTTRAAVSDVSDDDEDYLQPAARRSRVTTGLLIALIFLLGILVGTVLSRTLSPAPAPQIVYVLNDAGSPPTSAASTPR